MNVNLVNLKRVVFFVCFLVFFTSCSSDDDAQQTSQCSELTSQAIVNGDDSFTLLSAQKSAIGGFEGSINMFQLSAINEDCNLVHTLQIIVEFSGNVGGTYNVVDFFDAELNDAYGNVAVQNLSTMSSSLVEIASGTLVIVDNGNNSLTIDFDGVLENGNQSSFKTTHTF